MGRACHAALTGAEGHSYAPSRTTGSGHNFGKMVEKPALTPQALRDQAQQAIRLAYGTTDKPAKTALLAFAQELLEKAAQLEGRGGSN